MRAWAVGLRSEGTDMTDAQVRQTYAVADRLRRYYRSKLAAKLAARQGKRNRARFAAQEA